jgi:hypothetical protein
MSKSRIGIGINQSLAVTSLVLKDGKHVLNIPNTTHSRNLTYHGVYGGFYESVGCIVELVYNLQKGEQLPYSGHWTFRPRISK